MSEEKVNNVESKNSVKPAASVTLGICTILFSTLWYIAIPTGILAILLGKSSVKKYASKGGKAGTVLGIIGLIMSAVVYVGIFVFMLAFGDEIF